MPNTIWVDLLGAEVRYRGNAYRTRTIEAGSGTPLILMHGIGGHAEAYSRNLVRLGTQHRVVAFDFLWHGFSERPPFGPAMIPAFADQLVDLLDALGIERAAIEGESLGGWVAMHAALRFPQRVERLILNTAAGVRYGADVAIDHAGGSELLRDRSIAAVRQPSRETIRKRLEWLMASPDRVTDELVDLRYTLYTLPDAREALTNVFANRFGGDAERYLIGERELAAIAAPTLVLWTDKNPGTGPDAGRRLAACIPGAQFACIDDAAHWPQWEKPAEHDRLVLAFLAGEAVGPVLGLTRA